jgi:hypothetical protein
VTAATVGAVLLVVLTGCAPEPADPTPTPTSAFASEDEAFAAAEETYRAYVDAVNARREDPTARPAPTDFLIGDALEAEIDTQNLKHAEGLSIAGETVVVQIAPRSWDASSGEVELAVCIDSSATRVVDESGSDVTPPDRPTRYGLAIELEEIGNSLVIASTEQVADMSC